MIFNGLAQGPFAVLQADAWDQRVAECLKVSDQDGVDKKLNRWRQYPLVISRSEVERSTIFNGKIHYFDWAIFNSKLLVITRG